MQFSPEIRKIISNKKKQWWSEHPEEKIRVSTIHKFHKKINKTRFCKYCGKEFQYKQKSQKYCSPECGFKGRDFTGKNNPNYKGSYGICKYCGGSLPDLNHKTYCSMKCMSEDYKEILLQENNPHWNGGKSTFYDSEEWEKIRNDIWIRDNYTCKLCGAKGKICVHHIDKRNLTFDDSPNNLITLCWSCHHKYENKPEVFDGIR